MFIFYVKFILKFHIGRWFKLTIKGLGGFVKIDSGGVTISGSKVKINEGGSPGKGTAPKMVKPDETDKPQEPEAPDTRMFPVILDAAAALSAFTHPNHLVLLSSWGSFICRLAATPMI
ncbi:hypothetical protein [Vibrio quintilis]|uniref:Uncharacterized protein n=1 Tax=Vibrio quintilis TaxID=1117707 RepID=A0A1M7Z3C1_9VIBR|nr:hypothetical protein [Vibrio quintilis]SHO59305.1 hypothetical protein VQ7734_05085 [Vibrio quintilis]